MAELDEPILEDDYPIYAGYWYVVDGKPVRSNYYDITAAEFKRRLNAGEIRRCDAVERKLRLW